MINDILKPIKKELFAKLVVLGVDPEKSNLVLNLAKDVLIRHLKSYAAVAPGEAIEKLFSGTAPFDNHKVVQPMIIELKNDLISRLSVYERDAERIARFIIPFVMTQISFRINNNPSTIKSLLATGSFFNRIKLFGAISVHLLML